MSLARAAWCSLRLRLEMALVQQERKVWHYRSAQAEFARQCAAEGQMRLFESSQKLFDAVMSHRMGRQS